MRLRLINLRDITSIRVSRTRLNQIILLNTKTSSIYKSLQTS